MGCKSPVREPCSRSGTLAEVLAEGKGGIVRDRLKGSKRSENHEPTARATAGSGNPECKAMSRRTEMAYKAKSPGKSAPFDSAQGALSLPNGYNMTKPRVQEIG